MHRTQFLVDTDVIINYLKGKENARKLRLNLLKKSEKYFTKKEKPLENVLIMCYFRRGFR
ncbi:MAG: hypothetical protein ACNYWM_06815 [Methanosarcinales archaeon]